MDRTTLVLANVLLFALCAGVMLLNARAVGGVRGAAWFAGANLCRGTAMLVFGLGMLRSEPFPAFDFAAGVLSLAGLVMLHQSFASLLERRMILRWLQIAVSAVAPISLAGVLMLPAGPRIPCAVLSLPMALITGLIAVLLFQFSEEEARLLGWFTAFTLAMYALVLVLRAAASAYHGWTGTVADTMRGDSLWLLACLLTTAATAFGFMSLSTAKLRVELLWRAQIDDLTGLLNRWALKRTALREIQHCRRTNSSLAVVMLDLDGLKGVNDTKGHTCGDIVLQAVGGILQETVRARDSVARIGGDEFCLVLPDSSIHDAVHVAERLREEIYDLVIRYRGEIIQTRASLGVACSEVSGLHWQNLVEDSDSALYQAKRNGKNRVIVAAPDWPGNSSPEGEQLQGY